MSGTATVSAAASAATPLLCPAGTDLYRLAAQIYGFADGAVLILRTNGLTDPILEADANLIIPPYNATQANGGILASG